MVQSSVPRAEPTTPEPTTPKAKAPKKRMPKKEIKTETSDNDDGDDNVAPFTASTAKPNSGKKRGADVVADGETPTKKTKAPLKVATPKTPKEAKIPKPKTPKTPKTPKAAAGSFPATAADFTEADRLIVNMKAEGAGWPAIISAWEELTGKTAGKDVIRKRYPKLMAVAQEFKYGDVS